MSPRCRCGRPSGVGRRKLTLSVPGWFGGAKTAADAFFTVPALERAGVRLEPLTEAVFDDYWVGLQEPEGARLTGTHATFQPADVLSWLSTRRDHAAPRPEDLTENTGPAGQTAMPETRNSSLKINSFAIQDQLPVAAAHPG